MSLSAWVHTARERKIDSSVKRSRELLKDLGSCLKAHPLGLIDAMDWYEFFGKFDYPKHSFERYASNVSYYGTSYIRVAFVLSILSSFLFPSKIGYLFMLLVIVQHVCSYRAISNEVLNSEELENFRIFVDAIHLSVWLLFVVIISGVVQASITALLISAHALLRKRSWFRARSERSARSLANKLYCCLVRNIKIFRVLEPKHS